VAERRREAAAERKVNTTMEAEAVSATPSPIAPPTPRAPVAVQSRGRQQSRRIALECHGLFGVVKPPVDTAPHVLVAKPCGQIARQVQRGWRQPSIAADRGPDAFENRLTLRADVNERRRRIERQGYSVLVHKIGGRYEV
jgi:hypothetical protein